MDSRYFAKTVTTLAFKSLVYEISPSEELANVVREASKLMDEDEISRSVRIEEANEEGEVELRGFLPPELDYALVKKTLPDLILNSLDKALVGLADEYLAAMYQDLSVRLRDLGNAASQRFLNSEMDSDDLETKRYITDLEALKVEMNSKSEKEWFVAFANDVQTSVYADSEVEARHYGERVAELIQRRAGWKAAPRIRKIGTPKTWIIEYEDGSHEAHKALDEKAARLYARLVQPMKEVSTIFPEDAFVGRPSDQHVN